MKGEVIKEMLLKNKISQASLARSLGCSPQNLNIALNAKDLRTGLLEDIARALGKPLVFFYRGEEYKDLMEPPKFAPSPTDNIMLSEYTAVVRENERLKMEIEMLKKELDNK